MESSNAWEGRIQCLNLFKELNDHFASDLCTILSWQTVTALLAIPVLPIRVKEGGISFTYLDHSLPYYVSASKALTVLFESAAVSWEGEERRHN